MRKVEEDSIVYRVWFFTQSMVFHTVKKCQEGKQCIERAGHVTLQLDDQE